MNRYQDLLVAVYNAVAKTFAFVSAHLVNVFRKVVPHALAAYAVVACALGRTMKLAGTILTYGFTTFVCLMVTFGLTVFFLGFYGPTFGAAVILWIVGILMFGFGIFLADLALSFATTLCQEVSMSIATILLATTHYLSGDSWVWFTFAVIWALRSLWGLFGEIRKDVEPAATAQPAAT